MLPYVPEKLSLYGRAPRMTRPTNAKAAQNMRAFSGLVSPISGLLTESYETRIYGRIGSRQAEIMLHCDRIVKNPTISRLFRV